MEPSVLIIQPNHTARHQWREVWRYRDLFFVLAWRDVAVRYKQTVIGVSWALVQPLMTMMVFSVIFGTIARLPAEGDVPYPLMVLAGVLPWQLFATALAGAANSFIGEANLISKVYFPRVIIPAAAVVVACIDFLVGLVLLLPLSLWFGVVPGWRLLTLPIFVVMALAASLGPGLALAALNVRYRDFRYLVPFLLSIGLYLSPVGFSTTIVSDRWRLLYALNPMTGVITGFRWAILGTDGAILPAVLGMSLLSIVVLCWGGVRHFRRMEIDLADLI